MKANAPEKLYFGESDKGILYIYSSREPDDEIEYTRTDAFIDKACNLLGRMIWEVTYEDLEGNSTQHHDKMEFIEDFRNYIKG